MVDVRREEEIRAPHLVDTRAVISTQQETIGLQPMAKARIQIELGRMEKAGWGAEAHGREGTEEVGSMQQG